MFGLGFLQLYDGVDRFSWLPTVSPTSHSLVVAFHLVFVISVIFYRDYLLLVLINFIQLFFEARVYLKYVSIEIGIISSAFSMG